VSKTFHTEGEQAILLYHWKTHAVWKHCHCSSLLQF